MPVLDIKNATKQFGGLIALNDVSFQVEEGEIRGLIGPNGAGKSTLFKIIAGFYSPTKGNIVYQGQEIEGKNHIPLPKWVLCEPFRKQPCFRN